ECTPSRLSSACTCFAISPGGSTSTSTTSTTSSTTSSNPTTAKTTSTSSTTAKTTSTSTTSTTSQLVCNGDNCLNALRNSQSSALAYCNTYTMGATSTTPTWVPAECTPSRLSSACTCVVASPTSATSSIPAVTKRAGAGFFGMQFAEATTLAKRDNGYVGPDYTLSNGAVAPFYSSTSTSTTTVTPTTTLPGSIGGTTTSTTTINTMTIIVTSSSTVTSTNTVTVTAVPAECAAAATSGMSTAVSTGL
ncbi:hypothetical protein MMC08_008534, partial [Hypocenomyce scalaris]|nr:hypothetical protein [Hypocenomyce scalaris]